MRLINKAGLLAGALTTLLILASCSDSDTSTGVTAGRDAAKEILPDDESTCPLFSEGFACEMKKLMCNVGDIYTNQRAAQCQYQGYDICWQEGQPRACLGDASGDHDGDATVDDPTGPPVTDAGGGRDGDGQGSDTNSDAGGPKDACWDHDHVGNNGKLGRWVVGSNTYSDQEYVRNLANMNFAFNAPTNHLPASTKQAIHCVGDSATALVWGIVDDPTGPPVTDAGGGRDGDGHPVTPLYYASLEQCQNGKKHGDWVLYTQHCYDAGKSACLAYVKHWSKRYDGWLYVPGWVVEDGKSYEQRCESKKADANGMIGLKSFECIAESCALTGKLGYYRDSCDTSYLEFGTSNGLMCPGGMPR